MGVQRVKPAAMALVERVQAGVQACEGLAMRRKDEPVVGKRLELRDRGQPVPERVRFGLPVAERYVGRDTRQHLVAGGHPSSPLFAPDRNRLLEGKSE